MTQFLPQQAAASTSSENDAAASSTSAAPNVVRKRAADFFDDDEDDDLFEIGGSLEEPTSPRSLARLRERQQQQSSSKALVPTLKRPREHDDAYHAHLRQRHDHSDASASSDDDDGRDAEEHHRSKRRRRKEHDERDYDSDRERRRQRKSSKRRSDQHRSDKEKIVAKEQALALASDRSRDPRDSLHTITNANKSHWQSQELYALASMLARVSRNPCSSQSSLAICRALALTSEAPLPRTLELYQWDTAGDRNNMVYGSLYRGDVPVYRLPRPLVALGLPGVRLRWSKKEGCYVVAQTRSSNNVSRYCAPEYAWMLVDKGLKRFVDDSVVGCLANGEC